MEEATEEITPLEWNGIHKGAEARTVFGLLCPAYDGGNREQGVETGRITHEAKEVDGELFFQRFFFVTCHMPDT